MIFGRGDSRLPHEVEADRLRRSLDADTERIRSVRVVAAAIVEGQAAKGELRRMTSLAAVSDRIKAKRSAYAAKAEEWGARLDALDRREPDAFAATDAALVSHEMDLAGMEADMRALTNGAPSDPLAGSQGGSHG